MSPRVEREPVLGGGGSSGLITPEAWRPNIGERPADLGKPQVNPEPGRPVGPVAPAAQEGPRPRQ